MFSTCQFSSLLNNQPSARAKITGSISYPSISGWASFYQVKGGVLLVVEVSGLPSSNQPDVSSIFALHIHGGSQCSGNADDPFADAGTHYNPDQRPHPEHAGDLPPLFGNQGYAFMSVYTNRFSVDEVVNRTILIHASPDDFTTQPSGNSGKKIACGQIVRSNKTRN